MLNQFLSATTKSSMKHFCIRLSTQHSPEDRWTTQQINDEYQRPATGEMETPIGGWKQYHALWVRNLVRNAGC